MPESLLPGTPGALVEEARGGRHAPAPRPARTRRWRSAAILLTLAAVVIVATPLRNVLLRAAGQALVVNEPISPSDVIVISFPTNPMGVFEAADLVAEGAASSVAIFRESSDSVQGEFARRGISYPSGNDIARQQLALLGVTAVREIPFVVEGTEDQGEPLRTWFRQEAIRSAIVVTAPDHSRRLRRVLDRALKGEPVAVRVRASRHSDFDPDYWWGSRDGIRTAIVELQKLAFDVVRHPL